MTRERGPIPWVVIRLLVATALAFAALAAPAAAAVGPCLPGGSPDDDALCTFWTGKVTFVADGDTIDVDIAGDGTKRARRVRLTGFNAMELTRYSHTASKRRGACHGVEATARLEQLLRRARWRVRLAAQDPASTAGGRLRRQISARLNGRWVDVGRTMLAEGHALWLPNGIEWAWNRDYADLSRRAAGAKLRLWNPDGCGSGPAAALSMEVQYDPRGNESLDVNGEWAEIHNDGAAAVSLAGWWFRDSALRRYTFPQHATIPAGETVRLEMGQGANTSDTFHWGLSGPPFENPSYDERANGDGGYLFDPRGNLRAWVIYN
jgi:endonuclease YncB( thermonuclease family)